MPGLFGGNDAAQQASQAQQQAAQLAAQLQMAMFKQARQDVAPWLKMGTASLGQLGGLFGIPGYAPVDPTATLQATPGYQWMLGQGVQGLDRSAASKGMLLSGPQAKGITDWSQNLALNKAWQPYVNQLNQFSGQGLGAGTQTGQWGMQTGQMVGNDYMNAANAYAQGLYNQQASNNMGWGGLANLFGMGAGMLFGGGGLGSGLKGLFGSGGGGGFGADSGFYW